MNPWFLLGIVLAIIGAAGGGFYYGSDYQKGKTAREEVLIQEVRETAQTAAASEIAKIKVVHQTIRQATETITHEVPVYRDCHNTPDGLHLINSALENKPVPASSGIVPGTVPAH